MLEVMRDEPGAVRFLALWAFLTALGISGFVISLAFLLAELSGYGSGFSLRNLLLWLIAFLLLRLIASGQMERTGIQLGLRRRAHYRETLLRVWFNNRVLASSQTDWTARRLALFEEGTARMEQFFQRFLPASMQVAVIPAVLALTALILDWPTGIILLVTGPLIPVFMILIGKGSEWQISRQWTLLERLHEDFLNTLKGSLDLLLFNREKWIQRSIVSISERFRRTTMQVLAVAFLSALVLEVLAMIGVALVAAQIGVRLVEGWMLFPPALAVLLLAPEFYLPFRNLGARHHAGMEAAESAASLFSELDGMEDRREPSSSKETAIRTFETPIPQELVSLQVRNLSFSWGDAPENCRLFGPVGFDLPALSWTALAGPSGSGKSTLFRLLLALEPLQSGQINLGQMSLPDTPAEEWQRHLGWIPQTPSFFPGTLRDNLCLGLETIPGDEAIWDALSRAACADRVRQLPRQLDGPVSEAAHTFSHGERQRLALSRALLRDARYLLFDEPTSSLDPQNEETLLKVLEGLKGRVTLLTITHRHRSLRRADRLLWLEGGQIKERPIPA